MDLEEVMDVNEVPYRSDHCTGKHNLIDFNRPPN